MQRIRIDLHVDEPYEAAVPLVTLQRAATLALERELRSGPTRASVTITDDETLRTLNREHLGEDRVTDVLSFGGAGEARDGEVAVDPFPSPPGEEPSLGDVIISFPQAVRQADAAGHSIDRELALLTVHGILHLLGFDHAEPEEERAMFARQEAVLDEVLGPIRLGIRG
jgi:probable rRNA maturation factor